MENSDLLRRAEDLLQRCEKTDTLTSTVFLTPAERLQLERWSRTRHNCRLFFSGGHPDCERTVGFFLPDYLEPEWLPLEEQIRALKLTALFGSPGHRDYLGALLGMGIGRERLGDIWVTDDKAIVFCLPGVERHLLTIDKVGRTTVRAEVLPLSEITAPGRRTKPVTFSVQSPRLDAVTGGMFHLSRTEASRQVSFGNVSLNYEVCDRPDATVQPGDILSLRGKGKGKITDLGGTSRKGRQFVSGEIYLS